MKHFVIALITMVNESWMYRVFQLSHSNKLGKPTRKGYCYRLGGLNLDSPL